MICRHPGCGRLIEIAGYCDRHKQDATGWFRTSKGSSSARGYGGRWRLLRQQVLERDSYLCCECTRVGRVSAASDVDHIVPKSQGGTDELSNLQSLCLRCHRAKTQAESRGVGQKSGPLAVRPPVPSSFPRERFSEQGGVKTECQEQKIMKINAKTNHFVDGRKKETA